MDGIKMVKNLKTEANELKSSNLGLFEMIIFSLEFFM